MIIKYIFGLRGLFTMLALIMGTACIAGAIRFFVLTPMPGAPLSVAWGLVATCVTFVFVVGILWVYSLSYWHHVRLMNDDYRRYLDELAGQQIVGSERG